MLPLTREITLIDGVTPIPASLGNSLQDQIIGFKHGPMTEWLLPPALSGTALTFTDMGAAQPFYYVTTAAQNISMIIPTRVGDRITGVAVRAFGNAVATCTWTAYVVSIVAGALTPTAIGSFADTHAALWGDVSLAGPFTNHMMAAGEYLLLKGVATAAAYRFAAVSKTWDRL